MENKLGFKIIFIVAMFVIISQLAFAAINDRANVLSEKSINATNIVLNNIQTKTKVVLDIFVINNTIGQDATTYAKNLLMNESNPDKIIAVIFVDQQKYGIAFGKNQENLLSPADLKRLSARSAGSFGTSNYNMVMSNIVMTINNRLSLNQRLNNNVSGTTQIIEQPTALLSNRSAIIILVTLIILGGFLYYFRKDFFGKKESGVDKDGETKGKQDN